MADCGIGEAPAKDVFGPEQPMSYWELRRITWSDTPRLKRDLIVIMNAEATANRTYRL
jgi:hypothetical protein